MYYNCSASLNLKFNKLLSTIGLLIVLFTLALPNAASAQSVVRGPYLQMGAPDSIVVRWRTDVATQSVVRYGSNPAQLTSTAQSPGTTTEHVVKLSPLNPATTYFYSVGNLAGSLQGGTNDYKFITSPLPGTEQPTRIWVVGDSGTADANARAVRNAYLNLTGTQYTHLFLMLGDNAYNDGTDNEYQAAVFNTYPSILRQTPVWPTLGNHDGRSANSSNESGVYYDIFTLPRNGEIGGVASGTEAYYSFDYANIHFIVLDSFETDRSVNGPMMTWLQDDLNAQDQPWVIAFWHHPPYSKGSHNSDSESALIQMRQNALPILEAGGVDLVLGGHSHSYERSFLIDGHYGNSGSFNANHLVDAGNGRVAGDGAYEKPGDIIGNPHQGAVYAVAGSSGKISGGSLNHPAMVVNLNQLGSMILEIDGDTLDATFLNNNGQQPDTFRIVKTLSLPAVSVTASDPTATEAGNTPGTFTLTRTGDTTAALTVNYTVGGTATSGADYTALNGSAIIPAGSTSTTINVNPINDPIIERDETVILTVSANPNYQVGTPNATVTIESDEFPPAVVIVATSPTATEAGPVNGTFAVSRTGNTAAPLTVNYTVGGTATSGGDYNPLSGSITIGAGQISGLIFVNPIDDNAIEPDETVVVTLSPNIALYDLGTPDNATVTIVSDETLPRINITATDATATEAGPTPGEFTLTRSNNTNGAITVNYSVSGSATSGADYTPLSGSIAMAAGVTSVVIPVLPIDDTAFEPNETVVVTLTASALYDIGASSNALVNIISDDLQPPAPVALKVTNVFDNKNNKNYFPGGPDGSAPYNELRSLSENQNLEVEHSSPFWWQISFEDPATGLGDLSEVIVELSYRAESSWTGNFRAEYRVGGQVLASINLPVNGSNLNNFDWDLSSVVTTVANLNQGEVRLINSGGNGKKIFANFAEIQATFNANPPVLPTVSITASDPTATEAGPTNGAFLVTRTGDTSSALTVNYSVSGSATSGADYTPLSGNVILAAGQPAAEIDIAPVDDTDVEPDETVIVTLSADPAYTVGAANSDTVTITSDDPVGPSATLDVVLNVPGAGVSILLNETAPAVPLHPDSATAVAIADVDNNGVDDVVVSFPAGTGPNGTGGTYISRNQGPLTLIDNRTATRMAVGDFDNNPQDDLLLDFGVEGLWFALNDTSPALLIDIPLTAMTTGDIDSNGQDDMVLSFEGVGTIALINLASIILIDDTPADSLAVLDINSNGTRDVIASFPAGAGPDNTGGTHAYLNEGQVILFDSKTATQMAVGDFDGNGQRNDLLLDFGATGLWITLGGTSPFLLIDLPVVSLATGDFDANGQDDMVLSFDGIGTVIVKNVATVDIINPNVATVLATGNIDGN